MTDPRPEKDTGDPVVWIDLILNGTFLFFLLSFAVSSVYAVVLTVGQNIGTFFVFIMKPALHLLIAGLLWWAHHVAFAPEHRRIAGGVCLFLWAGLMFMRFGITGPAEPWESRTPFVYWILHPAVVVAVTVGLHVLRRPLRLDPRLRFATAAVLSLTVLGLVRPPHALTANKYGLVAMPPHYKGVADFPKIGGKRNYPKCTFDHNALGYRDVEPPATKGSKQRVLVVGDSYVWGDGIASNAETLPYRLRSALEKTAPGKYEVIAAAYPGNGVYGYHRTITTLQPALKPDIVVIGFLAGADFQAYDSQTRWDRLPKNPFLSNLMVNLGVAQQFHWTSAAHATRILSRDAGPRRPRKLFAHLHKHARKHGYRLLILNYDCARPPASAVLPRGMEVIELPDKWKYRGGDKKLWYIKEHHPRAALNALLGERLARAIVGKGG